MVRLKNRVRDATTGAGIASTSVTVQRKNGGSNVATVTTDANGLFDYTANGSPGDVEWEATAAGTTRVVAGDNSFQSGSWFTGELTDFMKGFTAGVLKGADNELAVTAPGGMFVQVDTGAAVAKGLPYFQHTATSYAVGANASGNPRIDRVIVRITRTSTDTGKAVIVVLAGTPAGSPVAPSLTQSAATWELSLAQIAVANGAASIITANITDERNYTIWGQDYAAGGTDVAVADGGTGASTAAGARTNLGVAATSHTHAESDVTSLASDLTSLASSLAGKADLTSNLSVFAATTSAQLRGVLSDETGSGVAVFGTSPTIATPTITGNAAIGNATSNLHSVTGMIKSAGASPTIASSNVGFGGSATIEGTDQAGLITLNTGDVVTPGTVVTVTFNAAKADANFAVFLFQQDATAMANMDKVRVTGRTTTKWEILNTGTALPTASDLLWYYLVVPYEP